MEEVIRIGDRVQVRLDAKVARSEGWFEGTVIRIDPYSGYRSFYWVEFDEETRAILGLSQISVFNPKNIKKA
ncbi:MAG: hypothetical protein HXY35_06730 [Chloroflexi bacterium]|nr:hypothetical protein [Chloroflexota bacterium]